MRRQDDEKPLRGITEADLFLGYRGGMEPDQPKPEKRKIRRPRTKKRARKTKTVPCTPVGAR